MSQPPSHDASRTPWTEAAVDRLLSAHFADCRARFGLDEARPARRAIAWPRVLLASLALLMAAAVLRGPADDEPSAVPLARWVGELPSQETDVDLASSVTDEEVSAEPAPAESPGELTAPEGEGDATAADTEST
jgi:hypothetical protein